MTKFEYRKIVDMQLVRRLYKLWADENPRESMKINELIRYIDFYHVVKDKKAIGWVGIASFPFDTINFLFINKEHRQKGYLVDILSDARTYFKLCGLLIGYATPEEFKKYEAKYIAAGFPEYYKMISLKTGQIGGEYFLVDKRLALLPVKGMAFLNEKEMGTAAGNFTSADILQAKLKVFKELTQ